MKFLIPFVLSLISASGANLLSNSSFEVGPGRGLMYLDGSYNVATRAQHIYPAGYHGGYSWNMIGTRLYFRPVWLTAGDYTLSFYGFSPTSQSLYYGIMDPSFVAAVPPGAQVTMTPSWTRFSKTQTISSNAFYVVKFYSLHAFFLPYTNLVDAVQLEAGTNATPYAPIAPIEIGIDTTDDSNCLFAGDSKVYRLLYRNEGIATTVRGETLVSSYLNNLYQSTPIVQFLPAATNTTANVTLPAKTGYMNVTARLYQNNVEDEEHLTVFPYAKSYSANTNAILGTHPHASTNHVLHDRKIGFGFGRSSSPAVQLRWSLMQLSKDGPIIFDDSSVNQLSTNGLICIGQLNSGYLVDGHWPTWQTNADGSAYFPGYTNWVSQCVSRYTNIIYWETLNEPQTYPSTLIGYTSPNDPNFRTDHTNLARIMGMTAKAIKDARANTYVIGMGGLNDGTYAKTVWNDLSPTEQGLINGVSCHIYPQDPSSDPNAQEHDIHVASNRTWAQEFRGIRDIWNTESGAYNISPGKGLQAMLQGNFDLYSSPSSESLRNEKIHRVQYAVNRIMNPVLRGLGQGFSKYIFYWTKYWNDGAVAANPTDPGAIDFTDSPAPLLSAVLMVNWMGGVGLGEITGTAAPATTLDAYCFTNQLGSVVAIWNNDRKIRTFTLTNTTGIGICDIMGNQIATNINVFTITRDPQYLVSSTLTIAQLSNDVKQATISAPLPDTLPPVVSFDIVPSGLWNGDTNEFMIKWSVLDRDECNWYAAPNIDMIQTKYKFDSDAYSSYDARTHVFISGLAAGNHTLYVTAKDTNSNTAEYSYTFDPSQLPSGGKRSRRALYPFLRRP
jgi:hypothetical protein